MKKILLITSLFIGLISFVSADVGEGCGMWTTFPGNYGMGGGAFGWIFGLLFLVVLVFLSMGLIKQIQKK